MDEYEKSLAISELRRLNRKDILMSESEREIARERKAAICKGLGIEYPEEVL